MTSNSAMQLQHVRAMKITPQMRQAIGLLQFNNRALAAFIAIQAASNPYLAIVTAADRPLPVNSSEATKNRADSQCDVPSGVVGKLSGEF